MRALHDALRRHQAGDLAGAGPLYERCLADNPDHPDALRLLGLLRRQQDDLPSALDLLRRAHHVAPADAQARADLVTTLGSAPASALDASWDPTLTALLCDPGVDPRHLRRPALAAARRLGPDAPLVRTLWATGPMSDPAAEASVIRHRKRLLADPQGLDPALAAAVALQAFHCDYAHWAQDGELARVQALVEDPSARSLAELTAIAAYRRLAALPDAAALADGAVGAPDDPRQAVIRATLLEPLAERALAAELGAVAPVRGEVSSAVRAQYEEHPYPRWSRLGALRRGPLSEALRARVPGWRPTDWPERPSALVAGCGTGNQPLQIALSHPEADVLGVDLSLASLGHAARKARELGAANLTLLHGDLLDVGRLGLRFDYIECGGVLHHLADPLAGWRALTEVLAPGGLMKIGLYSERARRLVVRARQVISAQGYGAEASEIRRFRRDLLAGGALAFAELQGLLNWSDFYTLGECRDLLFHVQEHRFTPASLAQAMDSLRLEFLGFRPAPAAARSLAEWEEYEQDHPDAFVGMYTFHCRANT